MECGVCELFLSIYKILCNDVFKCKNMLVCLLGVGVCFIEVDFVLLL